METMKQGTKIGLSALLPVGKENGPNTYHVKGWRMSLDDRDGSRQYVLVLQDGRETGKMKPNAILSALSDYEQKNPDILFKKMDGSFEYKRPVELAFDYTDKRRGFSSPYSNIYVGPVRAAILSSKSAAPAAGGPSKQDEIAAFL